MYAPLARVLSPCPLFCDRDSPMTFHMLCSSSPASQDGDDSDGAKRRSKRSTKGGGDKGKSASRKKKEVAAEPMAGVVGQVDEPDKLYCICRKPYVNGVFMIACDSCQEWYHGECVGIKE
jgi:hypothetical protein